jgi:hypothetical protein
VPTAPRYLPPPLPPTCLVCVLRRPELKELRQSSSVAQAVGQFRLHVGLALLGDGVWGQSGHRRPRFFLTQDKFQNLWWTMRRWIDELSFCTRVVLTALVAAIMIAVVAWDMIEMSF